MVPYLREPAAIYERSFALIRAEAQLDHLPAPLRPVAVRLVHACGMSDITSELAWRGDVATEAGAALRRDAPILCDVRMVACGIVRGAPHCFLDDPRLAQVAGQLGTTRSAAAVELWRSLLHGAVVAIGNAPTALFHLLERLAEWPERPAAILAFPVGFVGAAESKEALIAAELDVPFLTLRGRRGGSAMAAAAVNALAGEAD